MKCRTRRVALGVAALGTILVALAVVTHWEVILNHVEAWRFQLRQDTRTLTPGSRPENRSVTTLLLFYLVDTSGCPVITDVTERPVRIVIDGPVHSVQEAIQLLAINGYRVIEQRLPRRAYVVVARKDTHQTQELLWDELDKRYRIR